MGDMYSSRVGQVNMNFDAPITNKIIRQNLIYFTLQNLQSICFLNWKPQLVHIQTLFNTKHIKQTSKIRCPKPNSGSNNIEE
jgi:hypothetical protein